jgi:hypothetical protein
VRVRAPWATRHQWGYLYEALEVDGQNRSEFLLVPAVDKGISAVFLRQRGELEPEALHLVIWDHAGFHPRDGASFVSANVRLPGLPPTVPNSTPIEGPGGRSKDAVSNQRWGRLRALEDAILDEIAAIRQGGAAVSG